MVLRSSAPKTVVRGGSAICRLRRSSNHPTYYFRGQKMRNSPIYHLRSSTLKRIKPPPLTSFFDPEDQRAPHIHCGKIVEKGLERHKSAGTQVSISNQERRAGFVPQIKWGSTASCVTCPPSVYMRFSSFVLPETRPEGLSSIVVLYT